MQEPYICDIDYNYLLWDQEPIHPDVHSDTFDRFCEVFQVQKRRRLITSEKDSEFVDWACQRYGFESSYYFFHAWATLDWYRGYDHSYLWRPFRDRQPDSTFLCPNNIIGGKRKHRLHLFSELDVRNIISGNLVSFPARCPYEHKGVIELCREYGISTPHTSLPLRIDQGTNFHNNSHKIDMWSLADRSLLHVITETVYEGRRQHLTEKTFKPIVLQQPFVMVGCRNSLEYLRSYGFRTFYDFWDESYDQADDDQRIRLVADLLHDIHLLSDREKRDLQRHLAPVVEHNFRWFYGREFQDLLWKELQNMISAW